MANDDVHNEFVHILKLSEACLVFWGPSKNGPRGPLMVEISTTDLPRFLLGRDPILGI